MTRYLPGLVGVLSLLFLAPARGELVLSEVLFDPEGVDTGRQVVEIHNSGDEDVSLENHWLYFPPAQWQFPAWAILPAGERLVVHINTLGTHAGTEFFTGISGARNLRRKDAISLFRSNLFADPSQIVDFVQWGGSGNGGELIAGEAGIWIPLTYVDTDGLHAGASIAYDGEGNAASDWCVDGTPTLGVENDECTVSYARSPVRLNEAGYVRTGPGEYHPAVEFKNEGGALEDLGGKWFVLDGGETFQFPAADPNVLLGADERLVLHLGVDGVNRPFHLYTGQGTFRDFNPRDSMSLHSSEPLSLPGNLIDFVQWGGAGSPFEDVAVARGLWAAGEFVAVDDLLAHGSVAVADDDIALWQVDNTPTIGEPNDAPPEKILAVNEILLDPAGSDEGERVVELKNVLDGESVAAGGVTLCTESDSSPGVLVCYTIPDGVVIPSGGLLLVHLNRSGPGGTDFVNTGPYPELDPHGGVILLFFTPVTSNVNNLLDYVRWGTGPTTWEAMADSRHLWPGRAAVDVNGVTDSSSIAYIGTGDGADFYRVDRTPSIGEENAEPSREDPFRRGDCNDDGDVDISDAVNLFNFLFLGGREGLCQDACDSNDDGALDISDPVYILNFLFLSGPEMPSPGAGALCGTDLEVDGLTCDSFLSCPL